MPEIIQSGGGARGRPRIAHSAFAGVGLQAVPAPATGIGTSTGSTALAVATVTGSIVLGSTITGAGVPAGTTIVRQTSGPTGGAGNYVTSVVTTLAGIALTFTVGPSLSYFPEFTPIVPPPVIGVGGGPPPTFPPPTPPPIGAIPPGVTVGPAIAAAGVPPSLAGVVQPQFRTGSATSPAANGYFPQFGAVGTAIGTSTGTTTLAITSVTGTIKLGSTVTGTGVPAGTTIVSQTSGPTGGAGNYTTNNATTLSGVALNFTIVSPSPPIVIGGFMNSGTGQAGKSPPFVNTPPAQTPTTAPLIASAGFAVIEPPWQMIAPEIAAAALNQAEDVRTTTWALPPETPQEGNPRPKPRNRGRR